jgi:hypothetical protein
MINFVAGPMTAADVRADDMTNNDVSRSSLLQFVFLDYQILYFAKRLYEEYEVPVTDPYRIRIDTQSMWTKLENMRKEKDEDLYHVDKTLKDFSNGIERDIDGYQQEPDKNKKEEFKKNIKNKVNQFSNTAEKFVEFVKEELAKHHLKAKLKRDLEEKVIKTIQEIRDGIANNNMENIKAKMQEGTKNIMQVMSTVYEIAMYEIIEYYAKYRISVFAQDLFSYILLYPNVFREFKDVHKQPDWNRNGKTFENYLTEELERVTGRPIEFEIIDLFLSIIDKGGSLGEENEKYLKEVLISKDWIIDEKTLGELLEKSGLKQTLDKLYSLAYETDVLEEYEELQIEPAIDVGILTNINVVWDSVFDSRAAVPELVYFLGSYIPIIRQRFASCQPSPNQKDYFYDELKKVEKYLDDAISKETITELQSLQEDPISSRVLTFFRSLGRTVNEPLKLPTKCRRRFLYIIWWSLTKNNELSDLYRESLEGSNPPQGVNPSALFPGSLVEGDRSDGRFGTASLEQRFKYYQTSAKSFKEKLKQPGGLLTTLDRLRGYAI